MTDIDKKDSATHRAATSPSSPPGWVITQALLTAKGSPCRSKRGVVIYDPVTDHALGSGYNGPPELFGCPGRDLCRGKCGKLSIHAEARALREAAGGWPGAVELDLVHVELAPDGSVVACDGPSCWQCSREIVEARSISGVWLYQVATVGAAWHRYGAVEFHLATLKRLEIYDF
jgi:deoxycytidylate deaminase